MPSPGQARIALSPFGRPPAVGLRSTIVRITTPPSDPGMWYQLAKRRQRLLCRNQEDPQISAAMAYAGLKRTLSHQKIASA